MHTFFGNTCTILYDGDHKGKCKIVSKLGNTEIGYDPDVNKDITYYTAELNEQDLLDFIAEMIRENKTQSLENASTNELLEI